MAVWHAKVRQQLIDARRESVRCCRTQFGELGGALLEPVTCVTLARLELSQIEAGRVDEVELLARPAARLENIGERRAILLREPEEEIATRTDLVEPRRIEVDRSLVLFELARECLEIVVGTVVELLQPAQRGIGSLDRGEMP